MGAPVREICATLAGAMYAAAWWIFIDAHVHQAKLNDNPPVLVYYYIPAIVGTLGLFL